jgi:hypothetical protein
MSCALPCLRAPVLLTFRCIAEISKNIKQKRIKNNPALFSECPTQAFSIDGVKIGKDLSFMLVSPLYI